MRVPFTHGLPIITAGRASIRAGNFTLQLYRAFAREKTAIGGLRPNAGATHRSGFARRIAEAVPGHGGIMLGQPVRRVFPCEMITLERG